MPQFIYLQRALLAFALCLLPSFSFATDRTLALEYRAQWGNVTLAISEASWRFTDTRYSLSSVTKTKGSFAFIFPFTGTAELQGQISDGVYQPIKLINGSKGRRDVWTATTLWGADGIVSSISRDPELDLDEVFPLATEELVSVIDPFSAMLRGLKNLQDTNNCTGNWQTYDGRRHSDLALFDFGAERLEADRPWSYSGTTQICGILAEPLGGHSRDTKWRKADADPEKIKVYNAELVPGLLIPVRIEIDGILGDVVVRLNVRDSQF